MANSNGGVLVAPKVFPVNDGRGFGFSDKNLNEMARASYMDTFGFWQSNFGLYGFMQMNRLNKFTIYTPKGSPLMLQPHTSCSVDPTGSLVIGSRELTPETAQIFEQYCYDELFDSCFEHFVQYDPNGGVGMSPDGMRMFNLLVDEMLANATLGTRLSLTAGGMYDVNNIQYSPENTANITSLFKRTHGTIKGWVQVVREAANAEYPWLNQQRVQESDFDNGTYTGDIIQLYDDLRKNARRPLKATLNQGGIMRGGRFAFTPLFVVSDSFFNAVVEEYNALANQVATNRVRISRVQMGNDGGTVPKFVYYIDQTPIVPLTDINGFDQYVKVETHFAGIVCSGVIQMGMSFSRLPQNIEGEPIAMLVGQDTDIHSKTYGMYSFRTHMLLKAAISDPDYISATSLTTAA